MNTGRQTKQLNTWGKEIKQIQQENAEKGLPDVLFFGLEAHRNTPTDLVKLNVQALKKAGMTKVVVLKEGSPNNTIIKEKLRTDLLAFVKKAEKAGLKIEIKGVDRRGDNNYNFMLEQNRFLNGQWVSASRFNGNSKPKIDPIPSLE